MRIDRFLSVTGTASRGEARDAAKRGELCVNGIPEKDTSRHIDENRDEIIFRGQRIIYSRYVYLMLNKPADYICATEDGREHTVMELIPDIYAKMGVFPCGRLDKDTTGLLIMTNDGELAHKLLSPKYHVDKAYAFTCSHPIGEAAVSAFAKGLKIDGGEKCLPAALYPDKGGLSGKVVLREGKYHQVKRMFEAIGSTITSLERVEFGNIKKDSSLLPGKWRPLTTAEISQLKNCFCKDRYDLVSKMHKL